MKRKEEFQLLNTNSEASSPSSSTELLKINSQERGEGEILNSIELESIITEGIKKVFEQSQQDFDVAQKRRVEEIRKILEPLDKIILGRSFEKLAFGQEVLGALKMGLVGYLKEDTIIIGERSFKEVLDECALQLRGKILNSNHSKEQFDLQADICEEIAKDVNKEVFEKNPSKQRSSSFASMRKIPDVIYEPFFSGGYINVLLSKAEIVPEGKDKKLNIEMIVLAVKSAKLGSESIFSCLNPNINLLDSLDQRYSDKLFTIKLDSSYAEPETKNYLEDNKYFFERIFENILGHSNQSDLKANKDLSRDNKQLSPATSFVVVENSSILEEQEKDCCNIL